jgi:hypothetical protein
MTRLVTRGRFTHAYVKGLLDAPEDREAAVRKVVEAAGRPERDGLLFYDHFKAAIDHALPIKRHRVYVRF